MVVSVQRRSIRPVGYAGVVCLREAVCRLAGRSTFRIRQLICLRVDVLRERSCRISYDDHAAVLASVHLFQNVS